MRVAVSASVGGGLLWALGAVFFWSHSAVCLKIALAGVPWLTVAFWSTLVAASFYGIAAAVTGRLGRLRAMPAKELAIQSGIGVSGYFIYTCFMYPAYARGPAHEVLIVNYLWPVATVGFAALLSGERTDRREHSGLALAVAGVVCVVTRGQFHWPRALDADLLAVGGALFYGLYSAASKRVRGDQILNLFITYATSATLFLLTNLALRGSFRISHPTTLAVVGYHGVFVNAIPALLWLKAMAAQPTSRAAILVYLTPALGLVWLTLFIPTETIAPAVILGFLLIASGFLVQLAKPAVNSRTDTTPRMKETNTSP